MTCKTYLQTFHVILMRFTNHKITKSQITKSQKVFAIIIKKILYNLLIYYIYYNIYNILLFILVISLLPFLFSFCDFVILWFVILWQCTMKSTPGQEYCASYFDYPFATLQLATLQLAKRLVWMIMDELGWVKMSWDEVSWKKVVIL